MIARLWNEEDVDDLLPQRVSNFYTQLPLYQTYHVFQANWGNFFIFSHRRLFSLKNAEIKFGKMKCLLIKLNRNCIMIVKIQNASYLMKRMF